MARPTKEGLDYFPLDVDIDRDDDVFFIEAKHGLIGFAVLVRLYMRIYNDYGYFCMWTEKEQYIFSKQVNVNKNTLSEVVNDCINVGLFNQELYAKHGILTSKGIQKRFLEAVSRRKEVQVIRDYMLLDLDNYSNLVIENINKGNCDINVDNNPDSKGVNVNTMSAETPQSKVKKSKVKYINNICPDSKKSPDPNSQNTESTNQEKENNSKVNQQSNSPKYDREDMPYKAACYLRSKILENNNRAQVPDEDTSSMESWAIEMDRLNRLGPIGAKEGESKGYSWDEIGKIIDWCQDNEFWKSNILSAGKLREKITILENQMNSRASPDMKSQEEQDDLLRELYQEARQKGGKVEE